MRIAYHDILEKIEDWWPWHWWGDDDEEEEDEEKVNPDLNPVLLVPGIGGSILNAVNEKGKKERIWVRLFAADHEFRSKLFSLYNPLTGEEEDVVCLNQVGFCSYGGSTPFMLFSVHMRNSVTYPILRCMRGYTDD
jgi:hypothetical protein